jgi:hypothetical protein
MLHSAHGLPKRSRNTIPDPNSHALAPRRKKRRSPRTILCGYVLTEDWFFEYAEKHQLSERSNLADVIPDVIARILPEAGLTKIYTVRWSGNPPACEALAVAVGHKTRSGEVKIAPRERIERVKNALGTRREPSWYEFS